MHGRGLDGSPSSPSKVCQLLTVLDRSGLLSSWRTCCEAVLGHRACSPGPCWPACCSPCTARAAPSSSLSRPGPGYLCAQPGTLRPTSAPDPGSGGRQLRTLGRGRRPGGSESASTTGERSRPGLRPHDTRARPAFPFGELPTPRVPPPNPAIALRPTSGRGPAGEPRSRASHPAARPTVYRPEQTSHTLKRRRSRPILRSDGISSPFLSELKNSHAVDLRGFEPLTPSLRTRCATSCATGPCDE